MIKDIDFNQLDIDMMDIIKELSGKGKIVKPEEVYMKIDEKYGFDTVAKYIHHINKEKEVIENINRNNNIKLMTLHIKSIRDMILIETMICGALSVTREMHSEDPFLLYYKKDVEISGTKMTDYTFINKYALKEAFNEKTTSISKLNVYFTADEFGLSNTAMTFKDDKGNCIFRFKLGDVVSFITPISDNRYISSCLVSLTVLRKLS